MFYARLMVVLLALGAGSGFAAPARIDAASDQILRKVAADFQAAQTAEVDLHLAVKVQAPAQNLSADYALSIARPNKFALIRKQGDLAASTISDGTNAVTFLTKPNVYSVQAAPKDITGIETDVNSPSGDSMGSMAFVAALFSAHPYEALLAGVTDASFAGAEKDLQRVNFKQEGLTWSLFVSGAGKPIIRRIEVEIPQMAMTLEFSNWKMNPNLGAERFKFVPPAGARKVPSVYEKEVEGEDSDLVGEPLPALKLMNVDGSILDLSALKGKGAILVCWAGEADHSIFALRSGSELAARKGVAFAAINVDMDADKTKVQSILAKNKLPIKTALDPMGLATEKLEIEGVPMTFLIDKSGVIQKAWLGFHETFTAVVGKQLDLMLGNSGR